MSANKQKDSHRPPSKDGMAKEEFIYQRWANVP